MYKQFVCPCCGTILEIIQTTNWDNLETYFYPLCPRCDYTTKQTFDTYGELQGYLELFYEQKEI